MPEVGIAMGILILLMLLKNFIFWLEGQKKKKKKT